MLSGATAGRPRDCDGDGARDALPTTAIDPGGSTLVLADGATVSALSSPASNPVACLVLAHGAGAGMNHPFMAAVASGLAQRRVSVLRYQFRFMEAGSRRVDSPPIAYAAVRAAVQAAAGALPIFAGGKSFGGRMTSQAQAQAALPGVRGLVFLGFPLHPAGRPSADRARHLAGVGIPMLFCQGSRDALARLDLLQAVCEALGPLATLAVSPQADHAFHVPARSGRTDERVLGEMLDAVAGWIGRAVASRTDP